ncbi:MAG: hypothetical protein KGL37_04860 [Acidobacteriota bacterium]|nr:hypothetical protein [Acidobacteriota bacterium]
MVFDARLHIGVCVHAEEALAKPRQVRGRTKLRFFIKTLETAKGRVRVLLQLILQDGMVHAKIRGMPLWGQPPQRIEAKKWEIPNFNRSLADHTPLKNARNPHFPRMPQDRTEP